MKKCIISFLFFLISFLNYSQVIISENELAEKTYYLQPTNRNLSSLNRALPLSVLRSFVNSQNKVFQNVAELKTIAGLIDGTKAELLGYYTKGDGGGGSFYWDSSSVETDNGGTIFQVTGITTGRWKRIFKNEVDIKWFGAKGDYNETTGTDNSAIITYVLNNFSNITFSEGKYLCSDVTISKNNISIYFKKNSELIGNENGTFNETIAINSNNCIVNGLVINNRPTVAKTGRGLAVNGNYNTIINCEANGNISNLGGHGFLVTGDNNTFTNCRSIASGYAGIKNDDGDYNYFSNIYLRGFARKGFLHNGNAEKLTISKIDAQSDVSGVQENILIDPSPGFSVNYLFIDNAICRGNPYHDYLGNNTKIALTNFVKISNSKFEISGNNPSSIRFQENVFNVSIDNCEIGQDINFDMSSPIDYIGKTFFLENCTFGQSNVSYLYRIDGCKFEQISIKKCTFFDYSQVCIDIEASNPILILENNVFSRGGGSSAFPIWNSSSGSFTSPNVIYSTGNKFLNNETLFSSGNTTSLVNLFKNGHYKTSIPTSGAWDVGDIIYNSAPTSAGNIGWVCTTSGTPGTWQTFGTINLSNSATFDPPSLATLTQSSTTITVIGASIGDYVNATFSNSLSTVTLSAFVSASNTVTVLFSNVGNSTIDLASGTIKVKIIKL